MSVTIDQETYDKLQRAQALMSHSLPSGTLAQVLKRALAALIEDLESQKFAATKKPRKPREPRPAPHGRSRPRFIPARVRRAVWERDGGQCTFVSENGHRCPARHFLEFDHIDPVARGGKATVERMRLRCRGHNQYAAEQAFGAEFMKRKREIAAARKKGRLCPAELAPGQVGRSLEEFSARGSELGSQSPGESTRPSSGGPADYGGRVPASIEPD